MGKSNQKIRRTHNRSSHPQVFIGKGILKICSKFTGEPPCQSVISIRLQSNFIEVTLWHGCSPVTLLHIFRTPFLKNTSGQLLWHNYPSVGEGYSTSCKGIGGHKKKAKISKSKTTILAYFDNLKKKQQNQGGKNWCYTESFMSLTISNIRTTAFCFENIKLLK